MPDLTVSSKPPTRNGAAVVGIVIGVAFAGVGVAQHRVLDGLIGLGIMLAYAVLVVGLRRRSEAAQLLNANPADERQAQIMRNASAAVGRVVAGVLTAWWLIAIVVKADYLPVLTTLTATAGFSFMAAVVWYTRRG